MIALEVHRATAAAVAIAASLGLTAEHAVILNNSNRLTLRLLPCDVLARVAPSDNRSAQFELDVAKRLIDAGCSMAAPDPRVPLVVHERDDFTVTLWTYYEPGGSGEVSPSDYAEALRRMHAGMRSIEIPAPHSFDRVEEARQLIARRERTPALSTPDRMLLADTLRDLGPVIKDHGREQLLHGEPHPGNLLGTSSGPLFIDLETCCRGPIEFDLAHAPEKVSDHYVGVDQELLRKCRLLVLAMITAWRWDRNDQFPDGRRLGTEWLSQLRSLLGRDGR